MSVGEIGSQNSVAGTGWTSAAGVGIGALNSIISAWSLGETISQNKKIHEQMQKNYQLAKDQFDEETKRYNAREEERLKANKEVADTATLFNANPMTRQ